MQTVTARVRLHADHMARSAPPDCADRSYRICNSRSRLSGFLGGTERSPTIDRVFQRPAISTARTMLDALRPLPAAPPCHVERVSSGLRLLDLALGGGFRRAAVHELLAPVDGAAVLTVALLTAFRALRDRPAAWVLVVEDQRGPHPPAVARFGWPLERLMVIRAVSPLDQLWVCEQALRAPLVVLVASLRRLDAHASRRLQLAAERGGSLGLLIRHDARPGHTFAESRLRFDPAPVLVRAAHEPRTSASGLDGRATSVESHELRPFGDRPGHRAAQPATISSRSIPPASVSMTDRVICLGPPPRCVRVSVLKLRHATPPEPFLLQIPDIADSPECAADVAVSDRAANVTVSRCITTADGPIFDGFNHDAHSLSAPAASCG